VLTRENPSIVVSFPSRDCTNDANKRSTSSSVEISSTSVKWFAGISCHFIASTAALPSLAGYARLLLQRHDPATVPHGDDNLAR
jgi:hypothetical protein